RVRVDGFCTAERLSSLMTVAVRPFVLVDCEGGELNLLTGVDRSVFRRTILLVECHDYICPQISNTLIGFFEGCHAIFKVEQGPRNPHKHKILLSWPENEKWLVISESRPQTMHWLFMVPCNKPLLQAGIATMTLSAPVVQVV